MEEKWWFFLNRWSFWAEIFAKRLKTAWVCYDLHFWPFSKKKYSPKSSPNVHKGPPFTFLKSFWKTTKKIHLSEINFRLVFSFKWAILVRKIWRDMVFGPIFRSFGCHFTFFSQFEAISGPLWPIVTQCDTVWHFGRFPLKLKAVRTSPGLEDFTSPKWKKKPGEKSERQTHILESF